ncbi:SdrD B-like domain-containing protein [Longimicrobium sp.]|uniref:SdrD B-like domain-containing protein n=1 Tax=Longimicrobium sp. TaxID=2029185 RepID=UPI002E35D21E|nr:SdrD B-like domain-containing protein [Longimicrobium sp.]HEX6036960.1 SdrD B-like domain-containing protein [Longimicrobium sp.]
MRFFSMRSGAGDRGHRQATAWRGLAGALLLVLGTAAHAAAQVPDSLPVVNRATVTYEVGGVAHAGGDTATATVVLQLSAGVTLAPPRQATARPGERRVLSHQLQNTGTGPDRFSLETAGPAGWGLALYLDLDGDGVLGAGDTPVTGPLPLARGASAALLLVVDVPADAPDDPAVSVTVRAVSGMDAAVLATVRDEINVHRPLPAVTVGKAVDHAQATPGDTLTYTLSWANRGDAAAPTATLADPLPAGLRLVPGSLRLNGTSLTDAADADAGTVERGADGRETIHVVLGDLLPAAAGTVTLRAVVGADATASLTNVATLRYRLGENEGDTVAVASPAVPVTIASPELTIEKEIVGDTRVPLGAEVRFRLTWSNAAATVPVRDAVLVDTLPAGLTFVSADVQPEVDGQVLRWRLGTIAAGQAGALLLVTRATARAEGDTLLVNHATLRGANAAAVTAAAAGLEVLPFQGDELEVTKTAGVLEAGLGDAVPYAVTLRNKGLAPLAGIVLHDTLPQGVRYLPQHLAGADSARVEGRALTVWWNGPLAPGTEHVVRYAVTLVSPGRATAVENRVTATAEGGAVASAPTSAWVRVRRGFAMQQRVVVGKVWFDADDDGRQNGGERGVPSVEIWSEDGEVVVTDAEGRYSFPNLRTGSHALRIDTLGVPAGMGVARRSDVIVRVRLDGWTLPRADFRLVPRAGGLSAAPAQGMTTTDGAASISSSASVATTAAGMTTAEPMTTAPAPSTRTTTAPVTTAAGTTGTTADTDDARTPAIPSPAMARPRVEETTTADASSAPARTGVEAARAATAWTEADAVEAAERLAAAGEPDPCGRPETPAAHRAHIAGTRDAAGDAVSPRVAVDSVARIASAAGAGAGESAGPVESARSSGSAASTASAESAGSTGSTESAASAGSTESAVTARGGNGATDSIAPASAAPADSVPAARVAPLRTAGERAEEAAGTFATGAVVRVVSPADGAVVSSNRLYVGLLGEPGAEVRLFDGARQIGQGTLRPDGRMDFVGVELAPGPHRLRASMTNSFGNVRWDSVAVHRSGEPARLELPAQPVPLRADARERTAVRVRVLDEWGVPLAGGAMVTAEAGLAQLEGGDADVASVGVQAAVGPDGWAELRVRPGHEVGVGELRLASGDAEGAVPLHVLPSIRPLIVTGAGEVGVGAAPRAFGSVTARGAVGRETSVSVTWDSRRAGADENEFFGGGYDPLDEARYPTLGDGSDRRVLAGATQTVSARVEHGFDWVELGDVRTAEFGGDGRLGLYQRALTGVSGRMTTGAVTWRGYGSVTDQVLSQQQRRGEGTSGPYRFGGGIRPGTERVAIEIRALDNAARVIARQELARFADYQIDYATGDVLLNHPVPAADAAGNPIYVVAMIERRSGGERRLVGGLRMDLDALRVIHAPGFDSVRVSLMGVHDAGEGVVESSDRNLVGGGLHLRRGGLALGGELLRSIRPDSSAMAGVASLSWTLPDDRARVGAEWLRVGAGFAPGTDPRLAAGVRELRLTADARVARGSRLRLTHERQRFDGYEVERANTLLSVEQRVAGRALTAQGGMSADGQGAASSRAALGKVTMALTPDMDVWVEGVRNVSRDEDLPLSRPNQLGIGASYRVWEGVRAEASHRWVSVEGDSSFTYGLSAFNLRTDRFFGGQLWGGLERADDGRANHSAVLGWSHRLAIAGGWAATGMYERRFGLSRAPLLDPARALPFAQAERDRWSAGAGLEWLPSDTTPRFSARAEVHGGAETRGYRWDLAGDAPLGRGMVVLTRHDWLRDERSDLAGGTLDSRRDRSLLGLAFRPVGTDALNLLGKLEWRRTAGPLGGTTGLLSGAGDDRRLIGAMDAVWALRPGTELAGRWATRWSLRSDSVAGITDLGSLAHFAGARADQRLTERFRVRLDGRLLVDARGQASRWNLAPALVAGAGGLELEAGYRFGDLVDPDFAAQGGEGFYATLGIRFTEGLLTDAGTFWRRRLSREP